MKIFNFDLLLIYSNNRCMEFLLIFTSLSFFPTIKRPTLVSSNSKTLIYNLWTDNIDAVKNISVYLSDFSEHFPIFVNQNVTDDLLDTYDSCNLHAPGVLQRILCIIS